jgi:pimeloyl-ACP methyl ester carboxylesterase
MTEDTSVRHRWTVLDGLDVFYREAGPRDAPVVLLPHGYPCSSYQFRAFMPALADRWRLLAPDYPGFGLSGTPDPTRLACTFAGYTDFLQAFAGSLGVNRYVLYLHDYGSQIGLRLAMRTPEKVAGLIIQNGDIYEDQLGPKYAGLQAYFAKPDDRALQALVDAVSEDGFRDEFLNDLSDELAERIAPDLWKLHWALMSDPARQRIALELMQGLQENLSWFPRYQAYLRQHQPPTLIVWGPRDGYMPEGAARAYLRDLPQAELHFVDGGHWALETNLGEIVALARSFLARRCA